MKFYSFVIIALSVFSLAGALAQAKDQAAPKAKSEVCSYWEARLVALTQDVAVAEQSSAECDSRSQACLDAKLLTDTLKREKALTEEFLNDAFFGCN